MGKTSIQELYEFGQSVWLDNLSRSLIETGKLRDMIKLGLRGMTSNPTIFDKAISSSSDYDAKILNLCQRRKSAFEIYDDLTVEDVQDAADILLPVYQKTAGLDGYVSLEINPNLADQVKETIEEGKRLREKVNRPNVMFKVPATGPGFEAIEELTAQGVNVNITLIFSVEQYVQTAQAYLRGIVRLLQKGGPVSKVRSVASAFVSRIDTDVDALLGEVIAKEKDQAKKAHAMSLKGRAARANSHCCYQKYLEIFSSAEFKKLQGKGVNLQRLLWGSTSTKNPAYSDIKYVMELIGKNTINTMPEKTFYAFLDHGRVREALGSEPSETKMVIQSLQEFGIDMGKVCKNLLEKGVLAFARSLDDLLKTIENKAHFLCARSR
jgi:transaldolase